MKKVLIVDDEQSIVIYLTTVLDDGGYATCSAMDGQEGLDVARREKPDLICLDVMMPKRSGVSLYEEIRRDPELQPIPVMFISAYNRIRDLRNPVTFRKMIPDTAIPQPDLCMEKPIAVSEFLEAVSKLTGQAPPLGKDRRVNSEETPDFHRWISEELFDHVPLAICVVDQEFRIAEANERFTELYGEWRGRFCFDVYKGRDERCTSCGAAKTFRDGKTRQREEEGVDRQGNPTHYVVNIVPVLRDDGDVPYVIEMSRNIAELKTLQRQKLEAERLAAVGQTVAGLAHGIKNLIMGLEGGMYVVNSGIRSNNEERLLKGWKMLEEDIGRISSFVKEFLEFAKGRQPRVEAIQPNDVARKVVASFRERAARSGVELRLDLEELEEAPMDEEGLHACLTNLVLNAIDACVMSTEETHHVLLSTRERDGVLTFEVTDDGCGMDYEIKQRVFTNFFSTKASGKGTGLGLLTTRKIVQEHGGKVSFESSEGEGSLFRLEFPRNSLPRPQRDGAAA